MELSNLPRDIVEEIFSKLSVKSLRAMRLTCKKLNTSFDEKEISEEESMTMMVMDYKVYLMDINIHGIRHIDDLSIKRKGKLISLNGLDDLVIGISQIFHCNGLLLCVTEDQVKKLVVWNPYSAKIKWIEPRDSYHERDYYAIGYEKKTKNNQYCSIQKILRAYKDGELNVMCEIYNLSTNSWRVLNVIPLPTRYLFRVSVSLKGNTYWIAADKIKYGTFLVWFDFTRERFGRRLLPFKCNGGVNMGLSSVREEQLVVFVWRWYSSEMEVWVTSHIDTETVLWRKFLAVDTSRFDLPLQVFQRNGFFIDEEKKIIVVISKNNDYTRHVAYTFGEDGYFKQVDLGEVTDKSCHSSSCYVHFKKPKSARIIFSISPLTQYAFILSFCFSIASTILIFFL